MDAKQEVKNIVNWVKNEHSEARAKGFIVGLSGGIDSSVACGIAVEAVGKINVLGLILPYWDNRPQDIEDAKRIAEHYGIQYAIVPIKPMVESFITAIEQKSSYPLKVENLAPGNIQARARMIVLRSYAELTGRLVIGTTNLSEDVVGYFTKGGDGGSGVDIEPTAAYYKSEIRMFGKYFNLPDDLVNRVATAGLFEGQTDEGELGITYDDIEKFWSWETDAKDAISECPVSDEVAKKIMKMHDATEHKRNMPKQYLRQ